MSDDDLRDRIRPYLKDSGHSKDVIEKFLSCCFYKSGESYGDESAFSEMDSAMKKFEDSVSDKSHKNRLFYFAIPPNVFADTAVAIKNTAMQDPKLGYTRLIGKASFCIFSGLLGVRF